MTLSRKSFQQATFLFRSVRLRLRRRGRPSLPGGLRMLCREGCLLQGLLLPDRKRIRRECIHICPYSICICFRHAQNQLSDHKKTAPSSEDAVSIYAAVRLFLFLLGNSLLCNVVHDRSCDEDRCICTNYDTENQCYCKTSDHLATEDCDCKHCDECCE